MLFTTPAFLFAFLPLCLLAYFSAPRRASNAVLLTLSGLFYFWGEPWFIFVVAGSAALDYLIGQRLAKPQPSRACLAVGVAANLALLLTFKYTDFLLGNLQLIMGHPPQLHLLLPLGISFVVFEKITYLVDVYRRTGRPADSVSDYFLFVFFFPKMLAGPIIKYHEIEGAIRSRTSSLDEIAWGLLRFVWGLSKKVLIADVCGNAADLVFGLPLGAVGFSTAWFGVLAFTTEIYFDFSAYSDMAIGLGRVFGFRLRENFNHPYGSASFTEFWRRWHISLSTWIRDYLYIPLGGNRRGKAGTLVNLWTCFLLSGLWHGASWHFVLWGAWNGLFLICDKMFWLSLAPKLPRSFAVGITLLLVMVGWIIFRADSIAQLQDIGTAIFSPGLVGQFLRIRVDQLLAIGIGLGGALIASTGPARTLVQMAAAVRSGRALGAVLILAIGLIATAKVITVTFRPFLYFRF